MKKIYIALFALLAVGSTFTACTEEEPFATVTENDDPHILAPVFPDRTNGQLATFANISRDANLSIALTVTPKDYTTVTWFIDGQEVECAAIGNPDNPQEVRTTRPGEILAGAEFYTYDDKYKNGISKTVIPAHLPDQKLDEVKTLAARAYLALGCAGLARCDFFVEHGTGRVLCNELNTLPGFTPISMYPKLMENEGYSFAALVDKLIGLALSKKRGAY